MFGRRRRSELTFSSVSRVDALALRFPVFGRRRRSELTFSSVSRLRTFSHYVFQCLGAVDALGLRFPYFLAPDALALHFPMLGRRRRSGLTFSNVSGLLTLSQYACAAKRAQPV